MSRAHPNQQPADKRDNNSQPNLIRKMETKAFNFFLFLPSNLFPFGQKTHSQIPLPRRRQSLRRLISINAADNDDTPQPVVPPTTITPPDTVEIRFKRRSRKRSSSRQRREDVAVVGGQAAQARAPDAPKKWEDMSLSEKATELYMGEKGLLFWLNKFAYASIFIVIGGWIAFRFVGPALNLYQLEAPPLPPSSMFKGS